MTGRARLLDTAAIAAHYQRAPGTVRYWASVHNWTQYGTRRHRLWDLDEIQDKFDEHERRQRMTDQDVLRGAFALSPREAADPVALQALTASIDRELERAADSWDRVITARRAAWTLHRRSATDELITEPWTPGESTHGATKLVVDVEATTERTWSYEGEVTLLLDGGWEGMFHAVLQSGFDLDDETGVGLSHWGGRVLISGTDSPFDGEQGSLQVRLPDGRFGTAHATGEDGHLRLTGQGRAPYAVHQGALSTTQPAENAPRRKN